MVVVVLALVALAGGAALGVGSVLFGGTVVPFARRIAPSPSPNAPHAMAYAAVVLTVIASGGGALLARRASSAHAAPSWLLALGRPYELLAVGARGIGRAAGFLERGVGAMDSGIIDDIPTAFGDVSSQRFGDAKTSRSTMMSRPRAVRPMLGEHRRDGGGARGGRLPPALVLG